MLLNLIYYPIWIVSNIYCYLFSRYLALDIDPFLVICLFDIYRKILETFKLNTNKVERLLNKIWENIKHP